MPCRWLVAAPSPAPRRPRLGLHHRRALPAGEIAFSAIYKGVCIVALGASPVATLAFEIVLSTGSLFSTPTPGWPATGCGGWRRHARHAPRPPLHRRRRAERQLRLQLLLVGPARRHLPAGAAAAARDHADWDSYPAPLTYRSLTVPRAGRQPICSHPVRGKAHCSSFGDRLVTLGVFVARASRRSACAGASRSVGADAHAGHARDRRHEHGAHSSPRRRAAPS